MNKYQARKILGLSRKEMNFLCTVLGADLKTYNGKFEEGHVLRWREDNGDLLQLVKNRRFRDNYVFTSKKRLGE